DGAGDVRAVTVVVGGFGAVVHEVVAGDAAGAFEVRALREGAGVVAGDAGVDDGDGDALPARVIPRALGLDATEVPLVFVERVVRNEPRDVHRDQRLDALDARVGGEDGDGGGDRAVDMTFFDFVVVVAPRARVTERDVRLGRELRHVGVGHV